MSKYSTRDLALTSAFLPGLVALLLAPPPLNEGIAILWTYAAIILPLRLVLLLAIGSVFISPHPLNMVLFPGLLVAMFLVSLLRSWPTLAFFIANCSVYLSAFLLSKQLGLFSSDSLAFLLGAGGLSDPYQAALFVSGAIISGSLVTSLVQAKILRLFQARINASLMI